MEKAYSVRELDAKFKNSEEKNDAWSATILSKIEETHKERTAAIEDMRKHEILPILVQTTKTNGRVGILETRADKTESLVTFLKGGAYFFVPAFMAVSGWVIWSQLRIHEEIRSTVDNEFQKYEITGQIEVE